MNRSVKFYRDIIGLPLKFESPDWSEFSTGETTLALHPASDKNPAGKLEIGFEVPDLQKFHSEMKANRVKFQRHRRSKNMAAYWRSFRTPKARPSASAANRAAARRTGGEGGCEISPAAPDACAAMPEMISTRRLSQT